MPPKIRENKKRQITIIFSPGTRLSLFILLCICVVIGFIVLTLIKMLNP